MDISTLFKGAVALAPMEKVTDLSYRILCKELGADVVYTEFVNADGLVRGCKRGRAKMKFLPQERPIGIQIYGADIHSMRQAACLAAEQEPDFIDINAGCWVKKVAGRGAGAGLLKDPSKMETMVRSIVDAVSLPVTVKTRLGWDTQSIVIEEVAQRIQDAGASSLTVHCRTRCGGHTEPADWSWMARIKRNLHIPLLLNGGVLTAEAAKTAFETTPADGLMIARGAIGCPWIFQEIKTLLHNGVSPPPPSINKRIQICLKHLRLSIDLKGEKVAIPAFRRHYSGYLKGISGASSLRNQLMHLLSYRDVKDLLEGVCVTQTEDGDTLLYNQNQNQNQKERKIS